MMSIIFSAGNLKYNTGLMTFANVIMLSNLKTIKITSNGVAQDEHALYALTGTGY